jgi:hypothetical protein
VGEALPAPGVADDRFVFTQPDGVRTLVTANAECMTALPAAAAAIMASADRAVRS